MEWITPQVLGFGVIAVAGLTVAVRTVYRHVRRNRDPEERRRRMISAQGRIVEGMVTDFRDGVVYYTWTWRGVDYESSQEVGSLLERYSHPAKNVVGPASVKFLPQNPGNSIVFSETWNGFDLR